MFDASFDANSASFAESYYKYIKSAEISRLAVVQFGLRAKPVKREILRYAGKPAALRMTPSLNEPNCTTTRRLRHLTNTVRAYTVFKRVDSIHT